MKQLKIRDTFKHMVSICMTQQLSVKKGIQKWGQEAINAVFKEYAQLGDLQTSKAVQWEQLAR